MKPKPRRETADPKLRIVSLVPSLTELLFDLELEEQIVGRTHYCIHPAGRVEAVTSVGGTKKIRTERLLRLRPTHVIVNIDENTASLARTLRRAGLELVVTHPQSPQDNPALYLQFGELFDRRQQAERLCRDFESARNRLRQAVAGRPRRRVLYLIWRDPWMSVARNTYLAQTLALAGWDTWPPLTGAERGASRYPQVYPDAALLAAVDWVLFSTEPYAFGPADLADFATRFDCDPAKLTLIDGEMTSWYGSRAIRGLDYLREFERAP